jgi:hypothetical protein
MGSQPSNISASRGAAILGLSKWRTSFEVWQKIMEERQPGFNEQNGYILPKKETTPQLEWGLAFEDELINHIECYSGNSIINREKLFEIENRIITCHIDGQYLSNGCLHEGKTTNIYYYNDNFGEPKTDQVPIEYQIQCQHQMLCSNTFEVVLMVIIFPMRQNDLDERCIGLNEINKRQWVDTLYEMGLIKQYTIKANKKLQEIMRFNYLKWWQDHIIDEMPPEPQNYADIRRLINEPKGTILATKQIEEWSSEYKQIGVEESQIKKRKEQLKTLILSSMKDEKSYQDNESASKWILRNKKGIKLHSYNGKMFR